MENTLFTFGHGYTAAALTRRLVARGWTVYGTTRSPDRADQIARSGAIPVVLGGTDAEPWVEGLAQADHLLISAGPDDAGDPVLRAAGARIATLAPRLRWAGYLSTTGVYGDKGGDWVDETTPLDPATKRGQARARAEGDWQALAARSGLPLHIFRLAGIYGPGRGPFAKLRKGTARRIIKPGQVFSRIHVEDIATVLDASIARPRPGAAYNVCDNDPAPPQDVIAYAAKLLGLPLPPEVDFETADLSPMARSFYAESKRVSNRLIAEELGVTLAYPDYCSGLAALLREAPDD